MRLQPGLESAEDLTVAGRPTFKMFPSHCSSIAAGCCQDASVPYHTDFSMVMLECPHDMDSWLLQHEIVDI